MKNIVISMKEEFKKMRSLLFVIPCVCLFCIGGCAPTKQLVSSAGIGDFKGVEMALNKGEDINTIGEYGNTALQDASFSGHENIVRLLLINAANVNIKGRGGMTALHFATQGGNRNIVELLLNNGAGINIKSDSEATALHFAATKSRENIAQLLIDYGANVHAKDYLGQTALHKAAMEGSPAVVMTLIGAGSEVSNVDNNGDTPIFLARQKNNSQVVLILENEYIVKGITLNHDNSSATTKDSSLNVSDKIALTNSTKSTSLKTTKGNDDGIAVIIATKNYNHKDIPEVTYAKNDAEAIRNYLLEKFGYKDGNIIFSIDPTKADLEMIFGIKGNHKGILYDYIKPDKSDVFIYYSGHGAPDINSNRAYFVPKNGNPSKIAFTGYPLDIFYENISQLPVKRMTVVIDACFSGGTDPGRWIVFNASPALIKISNPAVIKENIAILTSSESTQISSWYPEKKHGLFTYFFLKGIYGDADKDNNREITFKEIYDFVSDQTEGVPYWAKRLHGGRVQIPTLQIMNDQYVFISY